MLAAGGLTWLSRKYLRISPQWQRVVAPAITLIGLSFAYWAAHGPRPLKAAFTADELKEGGCNVTASRPLTQEDLICLEELHKQQPIKTLLACDPNLSIEETENLLNRFPGLEGFGNRSAHLGSLDELSNYLKLFATEPKNEKVVLRALHIQAELKLSELKPISAHLSTLYHLFIDSHKMWTVDLEGCSSLVTVDLPQATGADLHGCSSLVTISLPSATLAYLTGCSSLVELSREQLPRIESLKLATTGGGLPRGIEQLTTLKILDLSGDTELTGLPEELLNLPRTCTIDLTGTGISDEVLERLQERCTADDYNGPRISHSVREERRTGELSIEESLDKLCKLAKIHPLTLQNIPNEVVKEGNLKAWLNRLSYMADYKTGGERQKQLAKNILSYLQLAEESEEYRASFGLNIEQAITTCGDRMAYYLLFLDLDARLLTMDLKDAPALADFLLKGYWQMNLLEECARNAVAELPFLTRLRST